jgi:valyl-tRNA synthetase
VKALSGDSKQEKRLKKRYKPKEIEVKWQRYWLRPEVYEAAFKFNKYDNKNPAFIVDTPPPFTSGDLHIGQAYWICIADTIARYKRMRGHNVLLPQGWDCQGLPTELKVQNIWKIPRENRELFRQKCIEWTLQMISRMKKTMLRLGYRPDWEQFEYRTSDRTYWRNVQLSLLNLFEKGLIYRDAFPVYWCPNCETALSQAELGYIDEKGFLFYIKFPHKDSNIEIATTRPELLSACQALVVHPEDGRYKNLVGEEAEIPLFRRKIPIIADSQVDMDFGTGVVMVCTFGDVQDIRWQQKYGLPISKVVDEQGKIFNSGKYSGLKISKAREAIVSDLKDVGLLSKKDEFSHKVLSHTERSDCMAPVEFLVKTQFFIKIKPFREEVINACRGMRWLPEYTFQRLLDWVNSIEWDWIISRQRVYGTPIPFWYCSQCNEIIPASVEQLPVETEKGEAPVDKCPRCGSTEISPSSDVCDCWVDSSITPLIISGYFKGEGYFERAYPVNVRAQGIDIIRTWLYYSILRCLVLTGKPPFTEVLIHGMILGPDGTNMSKSKGNVISPEERLDELGADSLRQAFLSLSIGSDFPFKWEVVKYSKGFLQKYWSASRFAFPFIGNYELSPKDAEQLTTLDKWILSKLVGTITSFTKAMDGHQFHIALDAIQTFFWHDFCDQYLEAVKHRLYTKMSDGNYLAALYTLRTVLWNVTLLLAPICPHITEEINHALFRSGLPSIHAAKWPEIKGLPLDEQAEDEGDVIMDAVSRIRSEKSRAGIPLGTFVERVTISLPNDVFPTLKEAEGEVKRILHIGEVLYKKGETIEARFG